MDGKSSQRSSHVKRLVIGGAIAALIAGGAGMSFAAGDGPGPNDNNNHGLCTAYFAGSENGQSHKHQAPPFVALEQAADEAGDGDGTATPEEVVDYCAPFLTGNGNGNGNNGNPKADRPQKG
jgi:hypothetical protein